MPKNTVGSQMSFQIDDKIISPEVEDKQNEEIIEPKEGYLIDFISGKPVKDTPEEREAVQVFSEVLVKDYGYPKDLIQTRPQWRVKARPSDIKKEYPVDIAVFAGSDKSEDDIYIIVECKKKNRKDGRTQLEDYLRFSKARLGVWFNGESRLFLVKYEKDGKVLFEEIPNIPKYQQRLEDVGHFKRKDLKPATNLKSVFKSIRNYLAANAVGITRDEVFAQQLINLIFCKIYDERFTKPEDMVTFRAGISEETSNVKKRIVKLFEKVKKQYNDVIEVADSILLDEVSLTYVVGELQNYCLIDSERDAVAEAFEIFIGPSLKGGQGQFFTPRNVVKMVVDMIDPGTEDRIIDPACGSGGFLVEALRYVWGKVERDGREYGWPENEIFAEKQKVAIRNFRGIDKDSFLSKVAKAYMAILGDGRGGVYCENSLESKENWSDDARSEIPFESFDVVITNPPFGKKLAIDSEDILNKYDLGYVWQENEQGEYEKSKLQDKQPPQILFIERCLDLLTPGGKLGIVLLESTFGMPKYRYVVNYLKQHTKILAIVSLPEDLFQPHTHAKTCVVICQKLQESEKLDSHHIFMSDVKWCGHDSRGNPTYRINEDGEKILLDDIPLVAELYHKGRKERKID
ncbi:restriction endonuclease subunit M [Brevibacillus choshinensis]|uniref:restriction endonuclease subunit M n=1 Tax=Brevibacillus choshinensis TaxID=54911 RepID=UPI002E1E2692|nr:N-6 DNA methylase [Brevibacillus choshinensis]MED4785242.1 N-6 DNA methylase [Brevibacillus choshinensis]